MGANAEVPGDLDEDGMGPDLTGGLSGACLLYTSARLQWGDVDLTRDVLEIRNTKFGKDRLVPFGPKLAARLRSYLAHRRQYGFACSGSNYLFSWNGGTPISTNSIRNTFRDDLLPQLALVIPPGVFGPHVHGLRHSFAVRTLLNWYRHGIAPADRLHHLALIHI